MNGLKNLNHNESLELDLRTQCDSGIWVFTSVFLYLAWIVFFILIKRIQSKILNNEMENKHAKAQDRINKMIKLI
jgi:preprotein translocase subunit Sec63